MEHADAIVLGEAESVWPRLVHDLERGALQRVYDARRISYDLAQSPMPRFDLIDPAGYNRLTVQSQRGCPFSCEFCASSIRLAPKFKVKPVERVIAEIRAIKDIWRNPFIEFADDNTFASKAHGKRLPARSPERMCAGSPKPTFPPPMTKSCYLSWRRRLCATAYWT